MTINKQKQKLLSETERADEREDMENGPEMNKESNKAGETEQLKQRQLKVVGSI